MSAHSSGLESKISNTLVWLGIFPFLAIWPFLSAFPLFSLINSEKFDIATTLNIIFFLTGFWPFVALSFAAFALMYDDTRQAAYKSMRGKGPAIGVYSIIWTGLYLIATLAFR